MKTFQALLLLFSLFAAGQAMAFPWYASGDNFRGAKLMTPDERKVYVSQLQAMKSFDECQGFMQAHNLDIEQRAKAQNVALPAIQGNPCEVMKGLGRIR